MPTSRIIFLFVVCVLASASQDQPNVCPTGSIQCPNSSRCIPSSFFCDLEDDCGDNSDEADTCRYRECSPGQIRCRSGQCIGQPQFCAGLIECADNSVYIDDSVCPITWCPRGQSKCPTSNRCIRDSWFCDGDNDCGDNSDENSVMCRERPCPEGRVKCNNGQCVDQRLFCDGTISCNDHTTTDDVCPAVTCEPGWSKCRTVNTCVMDIWICDGESDCIDNSDEENQQCGSTACQLDWRRCPTGSGNCIPAEWFCDGDADCPDGSDESDQLCNGENDAHEKRKLLKTLLKSRHKEPKALVAA